MPRPLKADLVASLNWALNELYDEYEGAADAGPAVAHDPHTQEFMRQYEIANDLVITHG